MTTPRRGIPQCDLLSQLSDDVEQAFHLLAVLDIARKGQFPQPPAELVEAGVFDPMDNAELADEASDGLTERLELMRDRLGHARGEPCQDSDGDGPPDPNVCKVAEDSRRWVGRLGWHDLEPDASRN